MPMLYSARLGIYAPMSLSDGEAAAMGDIHTRDAAAQ